MGFRPLLPAEYRSPIITRFSIRVTKLFVRQDVYEGLKEAWLPHLPGKVSHADTFRVGTIGHVFPDDFRRLVGSFAKVVKEFGWQV